MPERSPTSAIKIPFKEAEADPLPIIQHAVDTKVSNETGGVKSVLINGMRPEFGRTRTQARKVVPRRLGIEFWIDDWLATPTRGIIHGWPSAFTATPTATRTNT